MNPDIKDKDGPRDLNVLFVSCSGKVFKLIPFIQSQYESLEPYVTRMDHYRIKGSGIKAYIIAYKELKQKLLNENFHIIHAHWSFAGVVCSSVKKSEKLVISFLGNDLQGIYNRHNIITLKGLITVLLSQFLLFKADAVIVKSKKMMRWVPFYFRPKTSVIPNGVNLNKFKELDRTEARKYLNLDVKQKYILFLGDPNDWNKNFALLRKASKYLDKHQIDYKIISPFPVRSGLIPFYLASCNVLAFPSKLEGSPNIIKEAIVMKCPIVATNAGDVRERIQNINGCYIARFDSVDFAKKLITALNYNDKICPNGQLFEISESYIAAKIVKLYKKVI